MISGGAAFTFAIIALLAGVGIGSIIPRRNDDVPETLVRPDWGEIDRAATAAYRGAHRDMVDRAAAEGRLSPDGVVRARELLEVPSYMPRILLTSDAMPGGKMALVDGDGFAALTGVDPETVLKALGHHPTIRWGDTIPEYFTLG